jgi:hypothetical protein
MKINQIFTCSTLLLLMSVTVGIVGAYTNINEDPVSGTYYTGRVFISNTTFDPAVFFTGDKGTVTYIVTNGNANTSLKLTHGVFYDTSFRRISNNYVPFRHGRSPSPYSQMGPRAIITRPSP